MAAVRILASALLRRAAAQAPALPAQLNAIAPSLLLPASSQLQSLAGAASAAQLQVQQRGFAAAAANLASTLRSELKHEKASYEKPEILDKGPPAPFALSDTPGDTTLTLSREYKGESITVDCSVNLQDSLALPLGEGGEGEEFEDEEEEGEELGSGEVAFNVTVTRGEEALVFECIGSGSYWDIRHVSLEPAGGLDSETAYTGPVFQELDEELQAGFRAYLEERGVSEELCDYLRHLLWDKENVEYMSWLERVGGFVKGSK